MTAYVPALNWCVDALARRIFTTYCGGKTCVANNRRKLKFRVLRPDKPTWGAHQLRRESVARKLPPGIVIDSDFAWRAVPDCPPPKGRVVIHPKRFRRLVGRLSSLDRYPSTAIACERWGAWTWFTLTVDCESLQNTTFVVHDPDCAIVRAIHSPDFDPGRWAFALANHFRRRPRFGWGTGCYDQAPRPQTIASRMRALGMPSDVISHVLHEQSRYDAVTNDVAALMRVYKLRFAQPDWTEQESSALRLWRKRQKAAAALTLATVAVRVFGTIPRPLPLRR